VAPAFAASADFAIDKPAGTPCPHLRPDAACGIHAHLRERGFPGCVVYDCLGAGQHLVQVTLAGRDWRVDPATARAAFAALPVLRALHELLWYLHEAVALPTPLRAALAGQVSEVASLTRLDAPALAALDLAAVRDPAAALLRRASAHVRAGQPGSRARLDRDLVGADLRRRDLRGADLRGALLLGADLRGCQLYRTDLTGADLRGADLRGADLRGTLFLTRPQLAAARGDAATRPPAGLERPVHWRR
jgi:uncharacterized protein YjbI with pentapeptide repeats